ncbi:MAG: Ti-type conjugative transfer relaxase TraA, partial [Rhizobium sp.]
VDAQTGKATDPAIFTTREILRIEYDMAQSAEVLSQRKGFGIGEGKIAAAIRSIETDDRENPFKLDREQIDAVRHVTGDRAVAAVVGLAGAGKSTLLAAARVAWESDGRRVVGAALAGKAAEGLEDSSGIRSRTLASWELGWTNGRDLLDRGDIFVVDEAGMVSSQQMARVLKAVEGAGAKVVLVGDAMQLQPIQAGAAFRAIAERIGSAELAGVRRQREDWARDASRLFARGKVEEALDAYAREGRIVEAESRAELVERIVADWRETREQAVSRSWAAGNEGKLRGDEMLVLAHTNEDVKRLNASLREVMTASGALTDARDVQTERGVREFAAGDRIIFLENARFLEPRARRLGPQYVKNGMLGTVVATGDTRGGPLLSVRLDNGRDVILSEDSYRNIDHGYAATIHKAQGVTVDRTFVLATGMMDQHLTYVSMTRHRDRADLYAAKEDFEAKPEWGRKPRVDHAAGVTGELVETGEAKFRPQDDGARQSPYADVRTDDGAIHRLWGVSLPRALEEAGVSQGDTVTLRKDGVEKVKVQITVVDEQTGAKRTGEREVERNVWSAALKETASAREERMQQESRRPQLFKSLVERLSRSGAKTTTLDFESEEGYRAHAEDFGRRRGLDMLAGTVAGTVAESAAGIMAGTVAGTEQGGSGRLAWIAKKKEQVAKLWERASVALGFAIERERRVSYNEERAEVLAAQIPTDGKYLIPPTTRFARSIEEEARRAQLGSDRWKERDAILRPVLQKIYRDPDGALARLNALASDTRIEPRRLADALATGPQRLGRLRGSELLVDGRTARNERDAAISALSGLVPLARAHATEFRRQAERFGIREEQRRAHMSLCVPALSKPAMARLAEIEAVRERGGPDAYKTAFSYAVEDRLLVQEVKAVDDALTARFGWSAFTTKADTAGKGNMVERMPEDVAPEHHAKLVRLFTAVRRFAREQYLAGKQDRSQIVAGASVEIGKETVPVLPMLAAVTEFKVSVEEEARMHALAAEYYRSNRARLVETAVRIWRDPAGAVGTIEDLIQKGVAGDRIAAAVSSDPAAYGPLRGSDRIMDKLLATGRERKQALLAVVEAESRIRLLGESFAAALDSQTRSIIDRRRCMAVAIPGLSSTAEVALRALAAAMKKKDAKLDVAAGSLDPAISHEFTKVSRALDERFGRNAILRDEKDVINRLSPAQHQAFNAMRERLQALQQIVRTQSSQEILAERQQRAINRDIIR